MKSIIIWCYRMNKIYNIFGFMRISFKVIQLIFIIFVVWSFFIGLFLSQVFSFGLVSGGVGLQDILVLIYAEGILYKWGVGMVDIVRFSLCNIILVCWVFFKVGVVGKSDRDMLEWYIV